MNRTLNLHWDNYKEAPEWAKRPSRENLSSPLTDGSTRYDFAGYAYVEESIRNSSSMHDTLDVTLTVTREDIL